MIGIVEIFENFSKSLEPIQEFLSGFGYLLGIYLVVLSLDKFRQIGDARIGSQSQVKMLVPTAYLILGSGLIFLPSSFDVLANTAFGVGNVLSYSTEGSDDNLIQAIKFLIETAGILWFVRGSVLLVHGSEPGVQHGSKGVVFIVAGIFAMNFENTIQSVEYALQLFFDTMAEGASFGSG